MFRTDSSLKGVSRNAGNRGGNRGGARGSTVASGPGAGNGGNDGGASAGRDDLLEKAKKDREEREWKRHMFSHAVKIQSCWRQHAVASKVWAGERQLLLGRLKDVEKVATAFLGAGISFVPPSDTSHALILPLTCLWGKKTRPLRPRIAHAADEKTVGGADDKEVVTETGSGGDSGDLDSESVGNVHGAHSSTSSDSARQAEEASDSSLLCSLIRLALLPSALSKEPALNFASSHSFQATKAGKLAGASPAASPTAAEGAAQRLSCLVFRVKRLVGMCVDVATLEASSASSASSASASTASSASSASSTATVTAAALKPANRLSPENVSTLVAFLDELVGSSSSSLGGSSLGGSSVGGTPTARASPPTLVPSEVRLGAVMVLRSKLVVEGGLRRALLSLPEPKMAPTSSFSSIPSHSSAAKKTEGDTSSSGGDSSSSSSSSSYDLGGCALGIDQSERLKCATLIGALWRLSLLAIGHDNQQQQQQQQALQSVPPPHLPPLPLPPPPLFVLQCFAVSVLSVPLLFWREDGRDCGRAVVHACAHASTTSADLAKHCAAAVDTLSHPSCLFPLLQALSLAFLEAQEAGQPFTSVLPDPVLPHATVTSQVWVLGNLCALVRRCFSRPDHAAWFFNATDSSLVDSTALFLNVGTALLEECPLGLLSDTAAVTWSTVGRSHTPVQLPSPLLVQVRSVLNVDTRLKWHQSSSLGGSAPAGGAAAGGGGGGGGGALGGAGGGAASAGEVDSANHQGSSSSSSSSACSWSCFLEFLCSLHLEGLDSEEQNLSKVTKEDEAEAAKLTAASSSRQGGGALSAADMAQAESRRRKHASARWLDSTWAHRIALSAQQSVGSLGDSWNSLFATSPANQQANNQEGGAGGGGGGGRGQQQPRGFLRDTTQSARKVAAQGLGAPATSAAAAADPNAQYAITSPLAASSSTTRQQPLEGQVSVPQPDAVRSLCRFLAVLLRRWPPNQTPLVFKALNTLALASVVPGRPKIVQRLWAYLQLYAPSPTAKNHPASSSSSSSSSSASSSSSFFFGGGGSNGGGRQRTFFGPSEGDDIGQGVGLGGTGGGGTGAVSAVVCHLLSQLLVVLDDSELYDTGNPLPPHQIRRLVKYHKELLFHRLWNDAASGGAAAGGGGSGGGGGGEVLARAQSLFHRASVGKCLRDFYDRSSRRPMVAQAAWLVAAAESGRVLAEVQGHTPRGSLLLSTMPFALPFVERLKLFQQCVETEKAVHTQQSGSLAVRVRVRRGRVLEDGLANLNGLGANMKKKLCVEFVNEYGVAETGMDAGGLFKEFWTDLAALAFNMDFGLFKTTNTDGLLYPNPSAEQLQGAGTAELFAFLGRVLGKALYEGLTVEPKFAHFFLSSLKGNYNYLNTWHDLRTLDEELHRNLMFLKTYSGDASDLSLTFTVAADDGVGVGGGGGGGGAQPREVELVPGGAHLEVTNRNKLEYIERVANHLLVRRVSKQSESFRKGLSEIVDLKWLRMFNESELQVLISGAEHAIDLDDLKRHCRYQGGFTPVDKTVGRFWKVVGSLDAREQAQLLKFVTSCQRPPPLGFQQLNPRFCLQRIPVSSDDEKLPSAATCFNTLKLPTFSSEKVMKKKLLLSITSGAGFELT